MKMLVHQALCACSLLLVITLTTADVSPEEIAKINKGLEAGKDFTNTLGKASSFKDFTKALGKMNDLIGPWIDGIGVFSSVIGLFLPEDNAMLEAMKQGFKEVNKRLDEIKEGLKEVKEAIDWAVVKVNFQEIEEDIRLMDEKLKEVIQAPNPDHGKEEFIRVYENQYNEAGLLLWDAIVNDDQVFSENVLRAGMKYTDYTRTRMNPFMKGLIALLMKATNIEVSYEKFKEHDRGMTGIWKDRISKAQAALLKADKVIENAWKDLFRDEVNKLSKELEGHSHTTFRDATYQFLSKKYSWMYWFVLIYDDCAGWDNHALQYYGTYTHVVFRQNRRNLMISATEPSRQFDKTKARAAIKNTNCPHSSGHCSGNSAKVITEQTEWHGVSKAVIRSTEGWAVKGISTRSTWAEMRLLRGRWNRAHWMFYTG